MSTDNSRQTFVGEMIDAQAIRNALHASTDGQSGRYVYGYARTTGREFRMFQFKVHRGLAYGRELATGKWIVIGRWNER